MLADSPAAAVISSAARCWPRRRRQLAFAPTCRRQGNLLPNEHRVRERERENTPANETSREKQVHSAVQRKHHRQDTRHAIAGCVRLSSSIAVALPRRQETLRRLRAPHTSVFVRSSVFASQLARSSSVASAAGRRPEAAASEPTHGPNLGLIPR